MKPAVDLLAPLPYTALQSFFDPLFPKGIYSYSKSDYFDKIPAAMVDDMIAWAERKPTPLSFTHLNHFGGAMARVATDATPFAQRDATFAFSQDAFWHGPEDTPANVKWVKDYWQAMRAHSPRGAYVNFMADEGEDRVRESYRGNYDRLARIKRTRLLLINGAVFLDLGCWQQAHAASWRCLIGPSQFAIRFQLATV